MEQKIFEIRVYGNGNVKVVREHSGSWLGQNGVCSRGYSFTQCYEKDIEKTKIKLLDKMLKEAKKEIDIATKKYNKILLFRYEK